MTNFATSWFRLFYPTLFGLNIFEIIFEILVNQVEENMVYPYKLYLSDGISRASIIGHSTHDNAI